MKTLVFALVIVMLFCSVVMAEVKVVICPFFELIGDKSPAMEPFAYHYKFDDETIKSSPTLRKYLDDGWKIINDESLPSNTITIKPHKITIQR
jgi:hypothetical protein